MALHSEFAGLALLCRPQTTHSEHTQLFRPLRYHCQSQAVTESTVAAALIPQMHTKGRDCAGRVKGANLQVDTMLCRPRAWDAENVLGLRVVLKV